MDETQERKFIAAQHADAAEAAAVYAWQQQHLKVIGRLFPPPNEAMKVPALREEAERMGCISLKLWKDYLNSI